MQWIDEKDLATWAKRTDSRALLIDMVADLIKDTGGGESTEGLLQMTQR
ncbi:hypothetical protein [Pseudomonas sp. KK4]|nr:hypothetical protein [Pseudomonas sp. KK4]